MQFIIKYVAAGLASLCLLAGAQAQSLGPSEDLRGFDTARIEQIMGKMLSSINPDAVGRSAEKMGDRMAQDMASGRIPAPGEPLSPEAQEMQTKLQNEVNNQMRTNGSELIRSIFSMVGPILRELKAEMGELGR